MTNEQITIAIAELDGWVRKPRGGSPFKHPLAWWYHPLLHKEAIETGFGYPDSSKIIPPYLTSLDAIVPVIRKQELLDQIATVKHLDIGFFDELRPIHLVNLLNQSPPQLCTALLKATGKWEE